jgi:hypothetical protein
MPSVNIADMWGGDPLNVGPEGGPEPPLPLATVSISDVIDGPYNPREPLPKETRRLYRRFKEYVLKTKSVWATLSAEVFLL